MLNKKAMSRLVWLLICAAAITVASSGFTAETCVPAGITQFSTINAILDGLYDGQWPCSSVLKYGDFGIGTFDGLEGEAVFIEGKAYQAKSDGTVQEASPEMTVPFGSIVSFRAGQRATFSDVVDFEHLEAVLDNAMKDQNAFYAIRIDGVFKVMKARSCPKQSKPYPPLAEAAKHQTVFEWKDECGTLVGFRFPKYMQGVNMPGYHLHFISKDRTKGGHVLECAFASADAAICEVRAFQMLLPDTEEFGKRNISENRDAELNAAERGRK